MLELVNQLRFRKFDRALEELMLTVDDKGGTVPLMELQAQVK